MLRLRALRPRLVLSLALTTGCYVGPDLSSTSALSATDGLSASAGQSEASTGDGSDGGSDGSGGESSGAVDPSTTGTTGGDATGDPGTTADPTTGDPTTSGGSTTSGTTSGGSTTSGTTGGTTGGMGEYCDADDDWSAQWAALEDEVLGLVNQVRSQGANCGGEGSFGAAGPLTMDPLLRCAARLHSKDMVDRNFFSHVNPDNEDPWDRIAKTGYGSYQAAGENIAGGSGSAAGVMDQWLTSDGHCANIMNPAFNQIGVGYYPGGQYGHYWTQVFTKK